MTASKSFLTVGSLATAMLFGGGLYLYMNFGSIAKNLAERYASQTLGVAVNIGKVDVSLQERTIDVSNVRIANPPGYYNPHAVTVKNISIQAGELTSQLLEFKDISVTGSDVYLEIKPSSINLADIRKNLNTNVGASESTGENAVKMIIDKMVMNGTIHPRITLLEDKVAPIELPMIVINGIGRNENGVLVGQALGQVWKEVSRQAISAGNRQGFLKGFDRDALEAAGINEVNILKDQINQEVDKVKDNLKQLFE